MMGGGGMLSSDLLLREAKFEERRRRTVRRMGAFILAAVGGMGLMVAAHAWAPAAFDACGVAFLVALATTGLALCYTLRRHWRCPACEVRWEAQDVLASTHWNHCPSCGEALRAAPKQSPRERIAQTEFALENLSSEELAARFRRRRRRSLMAASAALIAALATLVWASQQGWSRRALQAVGALSGGVVFSIVVLSSRCPRCGVGVIAGESGHCQRCGLRLQPRDEHPHGLTD